MRLKKITSITTFQYLQERFVLLTFTGKKIRLTYNLHCQNLGPDLSRKKPGLNGDGVVTTFLPLLWFGECVGGAARDAGGGLGGGLGTGTIVAEVNGRTTSVGTVTRTPKILSPAPMHRKNLISIDNQKMEPPNFRVPKVVETK